MRAAIAIRVSPRPKENVRYSPELQEEKCRAWCAEQGIEVGPVVRDILVSGGAKDRFDSIFAALDAGPDITHFVVADLSRWTRDRPSRFWAIKAILEDRGVELVSVDESWVGSGMPFADTITTARVEANFLERMTIRRKTSAGVRAALASGKRMGHHWGWTWNPETRRYDIDTDRITAFFRDFVSGASYSDLAARYGGRASNVPIHIRATSQREVVGDDLWRQAQARLGNGQRAQRFNAKRGNPLRGMLACPFCGSIMAMGGSTWAQYYCPRYSDIAHPWRGLSGPRYIFPLIREVIARLVPPEADQQALDAEMKQPIVVPGPDHAELRAQLERLSAAWIKGRISSEAYETMAASIEARLAEEPAPPPTPTEKLELVRALRLLPDALDDHDPLVGAAVNRVLRHALDIVVHPDHSCVVTVRAEYAHWTR